MKLAYEVDRLLAGGALLALEIEMMTVCLLNPNLSALVGAGYMVVYVR